MINNEKIIEITIVTKSCLDRQTQTQNASLLTKNTLKILFTIWYIVVPPTYLILDINFPVIGPPLGCKYIYTYTYISYYTVCLLFY